MKRLINIILSFVAIVTITYFTYQSYKSATILEKANKEYYEAKSDLEGLIKRKFNSLLSTLTLGMVESKDKKPDLNELKANQIVALDSSKKAIKYFGISLLSLVILFFILDIYYFSLTTAIISLITLLFGVITPILMIVIHKNVKYLGDVILSFESKTILGTIGHLYHNGNYPIALTILLFSVIVPLIKSISMILVLIFKELHLAKKIVALFKHLGKWSMIDVFVVSLLLVYLSAGSSQNSYSQIENGTYIFLAYVILSIITSIGVDRVLSSQEAWY